MTNLSFDSFLNVFKKKVNVENSGQYVELEVEKSDKPSAKVYVKYFVLVKYEDSSALLNDIRSGYTLVFVKVKELREKGGMEELKRTITKIKRSADAAGAQIVGIDEDYLLVVPDFVKVEKGDVLSPASPQVTP
ncbi:MAG: cell division protein SepF [Candidatus Parvarchaeota archaeon]|nr:cell division protein SepF [Candidatus Parvarchaeota archaeon]MCW1301662.1 cell division protein SepF [Candidatus Parvarchaeota archaeon]